MDYFFTYIYFREVSSILKKTKLFVGGNFWFTLYKLLDILTEELFPKLCIPQRYLERNWKNSVLQMFLIYLQISKLHDRFYLKKIKLRKSAYNFPCEKVNFSLLH